MRARGRVVLLLAGVCVAVAACKSDATAPDPLIPTTVVLSSTALAFVAKDETRQLTATVRDQNGDAMVGATPVWASSNSAAASVSPGGLVTAVGNGTATITASLGAANATAAVTVQQVPVSLSVSGTRLTLVAIGDTTTLAAGVFDAGGADVQDAGVVWSTSDALVATVGSSGLVTAAGPGVVTLTATSGPATDSAVVTVTQVPASIAVSPDSVWLSPADTTLLAALVRDAGGATVPAPGVTWSSADTTVAAVAPTGRLTATGVGTTLVTGSVIGAGGGTLTDQVAVAVALPLSIATSDLPYAVTGVPYEETLSATGGHAGYSWTLTADTLPQGLSLLGDGTISGTPVAAGTSTFTVQVVSSAEVATQQLSIEVLAPPSVTTTTLAAGITGVPYTEALAATGGDGTYAWAVTVGTLPQGLAMDASGAITGAPATTGTTNFTVQVTSAGQTATRALTIDVYAPVAVTTTTLPDGAENVDYGTITLAATGGDGSYSWALFGGGGTLPPGLSLSTDGELTGTPTTPGTYPFTVVATSGGQTAQRVLSITVAPALSVTTTSLPGGVVNVDYDTVTLQAIGGNGSYAWALVSGSLPTGLGLATSGDITGTPTVVGTSNFTVEVTSGSETAQQALSVTVVSGVTVLQDGVPVTGLAAPLNDTAYFVFTVPAATQQLQVTMSGGTGDADMHVREGALPTLTVYDCRPYVVGNDETCTFASPASVDWYVMIHGFAAYTGVTLTASTACTLSSPGDADGDRLPDCVETNTGNFVGPLDTGTDPLNPDTDGDDIDDGDEVLGTMAGLDLPGLGVSPLVPSILIEYDWFDDSGHTHRPTPTQIAMVTASFAAQGVEVIHDYGQGPAPFNGGNLIPDADGNVDGLGAEFYAYKATHFAANRNGYFHYNMHPHRYNNGTSSGLAEVVGDDLITATLSFYGNDLSVAGTIQHELGHNLGLLHGGNVGTNRKPNYNSVMSYNYQFGGVDDDCTPVPDGVLDYSHGVNPALDENNLEENVGICGVGPGWDWNQDGDDTDTSVVADINRNWNPVGTGDGLFQVLTDHDDWGNLNYSGIGDADGAGLVASRVVAICQAPPDDLALPN